jgi:hypothetical protein
LLISEVEKKKKRKKRKNKDERTRKDLRGKGEDFGQGEGIVGGVVDDLHRRKQSRHFHCHDLPILERTYIGNLCCGSW